eukprot:1318081-Pleurochrysis_carterae.AAC.1
MPPRNEDKAARRLLGGQDGGGGRCKVFKEDSRDLAHEEEYAKHPILRLFTRPEEMENGSYMHMTKEDVSHMNETGGKRLTLKAVQVALSLHERHAFHVAVATDGAKKGGTKDRTEIHRLSATTYGAWQGPESADILRHKRQKATALQERLGVTLNQSDKTHAIERGVLSGRLGDSATAVEAELFAIFASLRKVQAQQDLGYYGQQKARVLIMSDCLSGLRIIEKVWRGKKNIYRKVQHGAVLEAITNVRESLGRVIFMWVPSHVGIVPSTIVDNIAAQEREEAPEGMNSSGMQRISGFPDISGGTEEGDKGNQRHAQATGGR